MTQEQKEILKELVNEIITETCTHWIVVDEKELNRVSREIERKLKDLILK